MKTANACSRHSNASENRQGPGRALNGDVSRWRSLVLKIFIAANDNRTRCAKATHVQESPNHRDHPRALRTEISAKPAINDS
jgi:hypothetical protein